jgi:hypothetical protein
LWEFRVTHQKDRTVQLRYGNVTPIAGNNSEAMQFGPSMKVKDWQFKRPAPRSGQDAIGKPSLRFREPPIESLLRVPPPLQLIATADFRERSTLAATSSLGCEGTTDQP